MFVEGFFMPLEDDLRVLRTGLLFAFARSCEKGQRAKYGAQLFSQNEVYTD